MLKPPGIMLNNINIFTNHKQQNNHARLKLKLNKQKEDQDHDDFSLNIKPYLVSIVCLYNSEVSRRLENWELLSRWTQQRNISAQSSALWKLLESGLCFCS